MLREGGHRRGNGTHEYREEQLHNNDTTHVRAQPNKSGDVDRQSELDADRQSEQTSQMRTLQPGRIHVAPVHAVCLNLKDDRGAVFARLLEHGVDHHVALLIIERGEQDVVGDGLANRLLLRCGLGHNNWLELFEGLRAHGLCVCERER